MKRLARVAVLGSAPALLLALSTTPADAAGRGPSICAGERIGQFVSSIAQEIGHSGELNPGNAKNDSRPFVPFVVGCNPNSSAQ